MYIRSVLSHLGGWQKLTEQHFQEFQELQQIIGDLVLDEKFQNPNILQIKKRSENVTNSQVSFYSTRSVDEWFDKQFTARGWHPEDLDHRLELGQRSASQSRFTELDALKQGVGVDVTFSKFAFAESCIFVKFPIFSQAKRIDLGVLVVLMNETRKLFQPGLGYFELLRDRIKSLAILPLKYPLVILGITHLPVDYPKVDELTSQLDRYLAENLGLTLSEMKLQTERPNYDFKIELSPQPERVAKEICALANQIKGGYLLVGVDNAGDIVGISRDDVDRIELRASQIAHNSVYPNPEILFQIYEHPNDESRCVLVIHVKEVRRKPCIANERVYVRNGNEAVAAKPDEIRKLVLGSGA